jgi:hypothetical protein
MTTLRASLLILTLCCVTGCAVTQEDRPPYPVCKGWCEKCWKKMRGRWHWICDETLWVSCRTGRRQY